MKVTRFRALVFDLAGVLLEFGGPESVLAMSDCRVDERAFFRFWSEAACAHDLHCGRTSPEEFARQAVADKGLKSMDTLAGALERTLAALDPYLMAFQLERQADHA